MATVTKPPVTAEHYLEFERGSELKHEFRDGEIIDVSGATREHILIVTNLIVILHGQLRETDCEIYGTDMRVKVSASGRYVYPDVTVVDTEPQFEDDCFDTLLNPAVIFEILSESTETYDRGEKFDHYRTIDSLGDYLLVSQQRQLIERFTKQPDGSWLSAEYAEPDAVIDLTIPGCTLRLADVYHKVPMPQSK